FGDPLSKSAASRVKGQALRAASRHAAAIDALEDASRFAVDAGDARLAAESRIGIVDSLGWLERFDEAIALAENLEAELLSAGAMADAGKVLVNEGNLYHRRDNYPRALECYTRALDRLLAAGNPDAVARVQANRANILTHLNRVHEAMALYEEARALFEERGDALSAAGVDLNVGFLRYISGEHSASLAAFARARKTFDSLGRKVEAAKVDGDMGDVYRALNLLPEALECYDRAIDTFREVPLEYETARAEIGRAVVLAGFGKPDEATAALSRADAAFAAQKNRLQRAHVALIRAHVLRSAGKSGAATRAASSAARELKRAGLQGWAAEAMFIQADTELEQGKDAVAMMEAVVQAARESLRGSLESRAHQALGRHYVRAGDTARALTEFRTGVACLEQARTLVTIEEFHVAFLRDKIAVYEDLVAVLLTRGLRNDVIEALDCVERSKSRLLLERVQTAHDADLRIGATPDPELTERLGRLRAELCRHYHSMHVFDGAEQLQRRLGITLGDRGRLLELETEYRSALREAEIDSVGHSRGVRMLGEIVPAAQLQSALAPDEALVEYASFFGQVCAFVVTRRDVMVRLNIAQVQDVDYSARRLRYHLQRVESQSGYVARHQDELHAAIRGVLADLYRLLLAPIEGLLPGDKLVIVPHGVVHGLPLHAAIDGDRYALDRWEMIYSPGAGVWYEGVQRASAERRPAPTGLIQDSALLMSVQAPGIELVSEEVDRLAELFPNSVVCRDDQATLEAFHRHAPDSRIIHLATHALFRADNPLFSGLSFADGWLLAHDIYDVRLSCDLATLSACRTGAALVEPGDELFGLLRGFLSAGARSLAVSMWPAADAATVAVMVRFYKNLAAGMSRGSAMRQSQIAARDEFPHPYDWAAFSIVGAR
ncbi:MAG: CHAT domain-containing protein, partial [Armatimonadetes bacterium]|nr:CHAT domain-containing protein [Armatimonadota bacterium]